MKKKLTMVLSAFLCLMLLFVALPMTAFAADIYIVYDGTEYPIELTPSYSPENVKAAFFNKHAIDISKFNLVFNGQIIADNSTLADNNVGKDAVLYLVCAHASDSVTVDGQAATCGADGWSEAYQCPDCDVYFTDDALTDEIGDETAYNAWKTGDGKIAATGIHEKGDTPEAAESPASCKSDGRKAYYKCKNCDTYLDSDGNVIADLDTWITGDGKIDKLATHAEKKVIKHNQQNATCTEPGVKEYYWCDKCGAYAESATLSNGRYTFGTAITDLAAWKAGDGKIVDADAHDYPDTWVQEAGNDKQHMHVCSRDDTHIEYADHTFSAPTVTKNADDGAEGEYTCECSVCNYVKTEKFSYKVTAGEGGTYTLGSKKDLTITANGEFSKFQKLQIDGADLDAANYTAVSGSTKVTLKSAYLETLKAGNHTIKYVYSDGSCSGTFNIAKKSGGKGTTPETGDADRMIAPIILVNFTLTIAFAAFVIIKKRGIDIFALAAASGIETVTEFDADAVNESIEEFAAECEADEAEEE